MSKTTPIRSENAIDEIAFVLQFKTFSSSEGFLESLIELHSALKETLPDYNIVNGATLDPQGESMRYQTGVIFFKRSEEDASRHEWALRVDADQIIVTCSEYTNWGEVSEKAISYLSAATAKFNLAENPIIEIIYQCIDKFTCPNEIIALKDIFRNESEYLTPYIIENAPEVWHIHQGWLEKLDNITARMLHNLKINMRHRPQAENEATTQDKVHEMAISHLIRIQKTNNIQSKNKDSSSGKKNSESENYLRSALDSAHNSNKNTIKKLLCQDMLQKIGLEYD